MPTDWNALIAQTRAQLERAPGFNSGPINVGDVERVASAASGLALVGYGLKRRDGWGAASALGGLVLLHRSYTGYCAINDLVGRDSANPAQLKAGHAAEATVEVDAPARTAYDLLDDDGGLPRLLGHLSRVQRIEGDRTRWWPKLKALALGLPASFVCEPVARQVGRVIQWRSVMDSPLTVELSLVIEELGPDRSRITVRMSYQPGHDADPRRLHPDFGDLLAEDVRRAGDVIVGLLAPRVEAGGAPVGATSGEPVEDAPEPPSLTPREFEVVDHEATREHRALDPRDLPSQTDAPDPAAKHL